MDLAEHLEPAAELKDRLVAIDLSSNTSSSSIELPDVFAKRRPLKRSKLPCNGLKLKLSITAFKCRAAKKALQRLEKECCSNELKF